MMQYKMLKHQNIITKYKNKENYLILNQIFIWSWIHRDMCLSQHNNIVWNWIQRRSALRIRKSMTFWHYISQRKRRRWWQSIIIMSWFVWVLYEASDDVIMSFVVCTHITEVIKHFITFHEKWKVLFSILNVKWIY